MAVAVNLVVQDTYPPRVIIAVTGLTVGNQLEIFREVASNRTAVRSGFDPSVTDTAYAATDAELPFGVPVRYVAVVNDTTEYVAGPSTYTLPGGKVALSDAITGVAAEVTILAAGDLSYTSDSQRFRVAGTNLMVTGPKGDAESTYDLFTDSIVALTSLKTLLDSATASTVQVRQPGGYDGVDAYLAVDHYAIKRWSQDGSDPRRITTIDFAYVQAWAAELPAAGTTYGDVEAFYAGLTYADAEADYATYLDAILGDYT